MIGGEGEVVGFRLGRGGEGRRRRRGRAGLEEVVVVVVELVGRGGEGEEGRGERDIAHRNLLKRWTTRTTITSRISFERWPHIFLEATCSVPRL